MSEKRFKLDYDGQAVIQGDMNLLGESSGLADDRVLAELLRLTPYDGSTVARGIMPYRSGTTALVAPNGASGSVVVSPFRAVIGSRTAVATDALANWRDIRSGISVAEGSSSLTQSVSFAANSSGNPRWDLVYSAVTIDANGPTSSRLVKDPGTGVVNAQTVSQYMRTTVSLAVVTGTAAASPVWPSAPSDAGSTYYVPIAYVRIPNGFSASSTVATTDVALVAKILHISGATGSIRSAVADSHQTLSTARQQAWGSSGTRPNIFIPPTVGGGETLVCYFDFSSATSSNWSHQTGDTVDSRDWRGRLCRANFMFRGVTNTSTSSTNDATPAWNTAAGANGFPYADGSGFTDVQSPGATAAFIGFDISQTINTHSGSITYVAYPKPSRFANVGTGVAVVLYVDHADSGKLKVQFAGGSDPGRIHAIFWLDFTGPYTNK